MILELDAGNSRIKWRLICKDRVIAESGVAKDLNELLSQLPEPAPEAIRICSVRKGGVLKTLKQSLHDRYKIDVMVAEVVPHCGEVSIHYQNPERLGVDRWLAMLSAYSLSKGACVVVDGGTALTIDVVNANGSHQGGYILPGLAMMRSSLEANTGIVLTKGSFSRNILLGHSTEHAVWHGALASQVALIEKIFLAESANSTASLFISGGDGQELEAALLPILGSLEDLSFDHFSEPDLVLDGLAIACPLP